jgi:hypothetical protein
MLKLSNIKSDLVRENEGDWVDIPDLPGVSLKVRSVEASDYRMARDIVVQKFARKYGRKPIPPDVQTVAFGKLYAEYLLLDWKGIVDDGGQPIVLTKDVAREHLTDPEYRRLVQAVEWAAGTIAEADLEFIADASKNSVKPSATT